MSGLSPSSRVLWLIGTATAVFSAHAEEFSWQLSGVTSRLEVADFHTDSWAVDGTYFVRPLDDSTGPYALASFLNPTTRVSVAESRSDTDFLDPTAYTLSGAYVLPGERWYVGANYAKTDTDLLFNVTRDDSKGYGVLAGRYLGANTTLELGLKRSVHSVESTNSCPPGAGCVNFTFGEETTTDSVSLDIFHVRRFRSLTYSLQGGVSDSRREADIRTPLTPPETFDGPSLRVYSVAGEVFPADRLGVRLGYSRPDAEGPDADSYDVSATWFFKPRIAVQFSLSRTSRDGTAPDLAHIDGAAVRFIGRL